LCRTIVLDTSFFFISSYSYIIYCIVQICISDLFNLGEIYACFSPIETTKRISEPQLRNQLNSAKIKAPKSKLKGHKHKIFERGVFTQIRPVRRTCRRLRNWTKQFKRFMVGVLNFNFYRRCIQAWTE
jgi:uncharacterized membrane protein